MEIIVIIAVLAIIFLAWLVWQLMRAKHFTQFKRRITQELKPKVIEAIINDMVETRSEQMPNTTAHQEATIIYWTASTGRVLQAALMREIIDEKWLKSTGNFRNCQHLFHIERDKLHR